MPGIEGAARAAFLEAFRRHLAQPAGRAAVLAAEFLAKVRESDMRYAGEPLDVAYWPAVFTPGDEAEIGAVVEATLAALEKATARFLEVQSLQPEGSGRGFPSPGQSLAARAYGWTDERLRVVAHDPGYPLAIPCARFDAYKAADGALRFLEVNTDGTSGMTNVERIGAFFLESQGVRAAAEEAGAALSLHPLRERVTSTLLDCYACWRERHGRRAPERPRVAIVDWRTVKTSAEFLAFVRWFQAQGLEAAVVDPRDLSFDGSVLRDATGARIDLVYRRLVSTELFAAPRAETAAFLAAYLLDAVCVVGGFRSDVAFDKRIMALVTDPEVSGPVLGLDADERALLERVFPWTRTLKAGPILERAKEERERLVLKPAALYEGRGVRIGVETDPAVWRAGLDEAARVGGHIVQERVAPPSVEVEAFEDGKLRSRTLHSSLGIYAFGGTLSGFIARVASTLVLSADDDERILPVVRLGARGAAGAS